METRPAITSQDEILNDLVKYGICNIEKSAFRGWHRYGFPHPASVSFGHGTGVIGYYPMLFMEIIPVVCEKIDSGLTARESIRIAFKEHEASLIIQATPALKAYIYLTQCDLLFEERAKAHKVASDFLGINTIVHRRSIDQCIKSLEYIDRKVDKLQKTHADLNLSIPLIGNKNALPNIEDFDKLSRSHFSIIAFLKPIVAAFANFSSDKKLSSKAGEFSKVLGKTEFKNESFKFASEILKML